MDQKKYDQMMEDAAYLWHVEARRQRFGYRMAWLIILGVIGAFVLFNVLRPTPRVDTSQMNSPRSVEPRH
jgi:hypothetical protein